MLKRRRAVLALFAIAAAAVFVLPATPASALDVPNACRNSVTANQSQIGVDTTADDSPDPVVPGGTVTLDNLTQTANVPGSIFVAGYNLGLLQQGNNTIPATVSTFIEGTNTVEGVQQTPFVATSISTTISDPDGTPSTGDETATDGSFTVVYPDMTFTASGPAGSIIEFREDTRTPLSVAANAEVGGIIIRAVIGGFLSVRFACSPGTVAPPDPGMVTFIEPAPAFDTTLIQVPEPQRQISINDVTLTEGDGGQAPAVFTVSLDAPSANPITVDFATADGTATAPGDYTAATGTVTFAPGDTSETVTVQVNGDTAVEPDETYDVNLSNATGNAAILDGTGVGTISNDDVEPPRQISISDASATEGGAVEFTVSLDAPSANPITATYATANGTAVAPGDYTSATGTVTFAPGDTSETVSVQTIDDALVEGTETFDVLVNNPTGNAAIADGTGVGTINDNDVEPQRQISIDDVSVAEGSSGQTPAQFTVSLDAASADPITVDFATADGTATAPGDYTAATGTVTFAPGDTSETVTVQVNGDTAVEPNETFDVNLSNVTGNATIADAQGVGTITNDDVAGSSISINDVTQAEGNSGQTAFQFDVTLSAPQPGMVTFSFGTGDGTATAADNDYQVTGGVLITFAPGETSEPVTVLVNGDTAVEPDETFVVNLGNATGNATILDGQGVGTITNDDVAGQRQISISDAAATEGGAVQFTVSLSAPQAGSVTVDYATADGSAVAPGDYTAGTGTVTFAPGDTSETVSVQTNDDALVEGTETFDVNLSNPTGNATIADGLGVGTINDNDVAEPQRQISISDASATEGGAVEFTVSLDAASANPITVDYATADGSAVAPGDYTAGTGTVTFAPGDTSETVSVQTNDDALVEGTETFDVNLSNPTGNAAIADGLGVGTINDNDVAEPQRQISISDASATEGGAVEFTVSLDAASANPITVDYATADGSAVAPGDYTAGTGTVTFAPGDTSETVSVQTNDDALVEGTETFDVNLSNADRQRGDRRRPRRRDDQRQRRR